MKGKVKKEKEIVVKLKVLDKNLIEESLKDSILRLKHNISSWKTIDVDKDIRKDVDKKLKYELSEYERVLSLINSKQIQEIRNE